jgi:DNA polymerase I-like protein with 3'-5' exonuclease and polymerase domains
MKAEGRTYDERGQFTGEGPARALRDLAKRVQYASQYMATVETVHRVITQTEIFDKKTGESELPYLNLSMREVRHMHERWLESVPEFEKGWEREIGEWRTQGYLAEPVTGRRRDFLDGENPNELVNFKIQASAAALMNIAALELVERIPTEKWGVGTGLINQCHDSLVVECPEKDAQWVSNVLEECMNQEHSGIPNVRFTASAEIGQTWKQVG